MGCGKPTLDKKPVRLQWFPGSSGAWPSSLWSVEKLIDSHPLIHDFRQWRRLPSKWYAPSSFLDSPLLLSRERHFDIQTSYHIRRVSTSESGIVSCTSKNENSDINQQNRGHDHEHHISLLIFGWYIHPPRPGLKNF